MRRDLRRWVKVRFWFVPCELHVDILSSDRNAKWAWSDSDKHNWWQKRIGDIGFNVYVLWAQRRLFLNGTIDILRKWNENWQIGHSFFHCQSLEKFIGAVIFVTYSLHPFENRNKNVISSPSSLHLLFMGTVAYIYIYITAAILSLNHFYQYW